VDDRELEAAFRAFYEAATTPPPDASGWTPENLARKTGLPIERIEAVLKLIDEHPASQRSREAGERAERTGAGIWSIGLPPDPAKGEKQPPRGNDFFPV
jgi:hypothetical protein